MSSAVDSDDDIQVAAWSQEVFECLSEEKMLHSVDISGGTRLWWPTRYNPTMFHYNLTERGALRIERDETGISEWSLDNHIFTLAIFPYYEPYHRIEGEEDSVPKLLELVFNDIRPEATPFESPEFCEFFEKHEVLEDKYPIITPHSSLNYQAIWEGLTEWLFWQSPSRNTKLLEHTEHASVNFLRTREFDDAMRNYVEPNAEYRSYLPYGRVKDWLRECHATKHSFAIVRAQNLGMDDSARALLQIAHHTAQCCEFIDMFTKSLRPAEWRDVLEGRLLRYPLGGTVDDAIYVPVITFFEDLCQATELPSATVTQLLSDISFFRSPRGTDTDTTLKLPLLLIRHQTRTPHQTEFDVATQNEQRLYFVSAAQFLATLGITGFPVYGLTTCGMEGFVYAAWFSDEQQCLHIADRGTPEHRFDLSTTEGIACYVGFLGRIAERAEELQARFEEVKPALLERVKTEEGRASLQWTLRAQFDQYKLWPQAEAGEFDPPTTVTQLQGLLNRHEDLVKLCTPETEDHVREDVKDMWLEYEAGKIRT